MISAPNQRPAMALRLGFPHLDMTGRTSVFLSHSDFIDDANVIPPAEGDSAPR